MTVSLRKTRRPLEMDGQNGYPSSSICLTKQNWMLSLDRNGKFYVMDFFLNHDLNKNEDAMRRARSPVRDALINDAFTEWPWTTKPES